MNNIFHLTLKGQINKYSAFPLLENCLNTAKKKATTFSRLLRGLKTAHRKEKHGNCSPKQARQARAQGLPPQRVSFHFALYIISHAVLIYTHFILNLTLRRTSSRFYNLMCYLMKMFYPFFVCISNIYCIIYNIFFDLYHRRFVVFYVIN